MATISILWGLPRGEWLLCLRKSVVSPTCVSLRPKDSQALMSNLIAIASRVTDGPMEDVADTVAAGLGGGPAGILFNADRLYPLGGPGPPVERTHLDASVALPCL